jgi:phosphoribosylamine--glycine ligase
VRVLVVGGGGREHALCWKFRQSPLCEALYCAPGNGGIGTIAEIVPIAAKEHQQLAEWALGHQVDLTVVGPDGPLADGIVDHFEGRGLRIFGPTRAAAQIEWSKSWAKEFCLAHAIPIGQFTTFGDAEAAHRHVDQAPSGVAVKADGLALGKGVVICQTRAEAHAAIDAMMRERTVGSAGERLVIEELLVGREVSAFAICDGATYRMLPFACDHKAIFDGDRGPNTGGMGAYSPVPWLSSEQVREIELRVIAPAVRGLARAGRPFVGYLFAGLIVTAAGIRVIEFNARFGDPEAQAIFPRLGFDLLALIDQARAGNLAAAPVDLPINAGAACCVVAASGGYPGAFQAGFAIEGLDLVGPDTIVFHAGTRRDGDRYLSAGGRVLGVTGLGADLEAARARAYASVERIRFPAMQYRRDIGR